MNEYSLSNEDPILDSNEAHSKEAGMPHQHRSDIKVRYVLMILICFCFLGLLVGGLLTYLLAQVFSWSDDVMMSNLTDASPAIDIWWVRLQAGISQLFVFLIPACATVWMFRRLEPQMWHGVSLLRRPSVGSIAVGIALLLVSTPFILYSYQINKMIPLPAEIQATYEKLNAMTKILLKMPTSLDFIGCLFLIGLMPAFGEELFFRGVIQQQLVRRMNPWAAILITGAVFSAFHLQFDGFLPRWLLGSLLGWLYWRSGNFWLPVLAHFFNNSIQVVAQYLFYNKIIAVDLDQDTHIQWWAAGLSAALIVGLGMVFTSLHNQRIAPQQNSLQ